ncbi:uncharacterized protein LOC141914087 [Tubulanus polymorphus]|uniref:uncharacterized protein LOC141914087 n=1 Tax=Tubulanus polymorphus TaxID=672921 RepID=UPI003DA35C4B
MARSHGHYGTTKRAAISRTETYIHHKVEKDETLQGIALKYGVTMEHIKRANKIWTNDSLYLRDELLIPLVHTSEHATFQGQNGDSTNADGGENFAQHNFSTGFTSRGHRAASSPRNSPRRSVGNNDTVICTTTAAAVDTKSNSRDSNAKNRTNRSRTEDGGAAVAPPVEISARDFLSKFDVNLAKIKKDVKAMEQKTEFSVTDERNPLNHLSAKTSRYVRRPRGHSLDSQHNSDAAGTSSSTSSPELVIKSKVRSQQINKSVARFEPAHEQLFQL